MLESLAGALRRPRRSGRRPQGGLFIWATLDDASTRPTCSRRSEGVAFVPGRAAYMDGRRAAPPRCGSTSRASPDEDIREGIRRIGGSMRRTGGPARGAHRLRRGAGGRRTRPDVTRRPTPAERGRAASGAGRRRAAAPPRDDQGPRRSGARIDERRRPRRSPSSRAGARWSATVSLRSGAQAQDALRAARPRGDGDRRRPRSRRALREDRARRGVHRAARRRRRGRHRAGAAGGDRHPLHRLGPGGLHALRRQGAGQAPDARGRHPHAGLPAFKETAIKELGARRGAAGRRAKPRVPARRQAGQPGLGAGRQVRAHSDGAPGGDRGRVLLRPQGRCSSATSAAATSRSRCSIDAAADAEPVALPVVEAIPRERTSTTSSRATRSG